MDLDSSDTENVPRKAVSAKKTGGAYDSKLGAYRVISKTAENWASGQKFS